MRQLFKATKTKTQQSQSLLNSYDQRLTLKDTALKTQMLFFKRQKQRIATKAKDRNFSLKGKANDLHH